jgi:ammonium transporter, Amt family
LVVPLGWLLQVLPPSVLRFGGVVQRRWAVNCALMAFYGFIHLSAGVSGFVAAAVIGPRLARDRAEPNPSNLMMTMVGAGLLWLGWNGFNGGDPYFAGADAAAAVLNTNLAAATALLTWLTMDMLARGKPSLAGVINGMITGLVTITPAADFVNGFGAIVIGIGPALAGSAVVEA